MLSKFISSACYIYIPISPSRYPDIGSPAEGASTDKSKEICTDKSTEGKNTILLTQYYIVHSIRKIGSLLVLVAEAYFTFVFFDVSVVSLPVNTSYCFSKLFDRCSAVIRDFFETLEQSGSQRRTILGWIGLDSGGLDQSASNHQQKKLGIYQ